MKPSLSLSQIKDLTSCPRKFELLHVLRVPFRLPASWFFGSCYHECVEAVLTEKMNGKELGGPELVSLFHEAYSNPLSRPHGEDPGGQPIDVDWEGEDKDVLERTGFTLVSLFRDQIVPELDPVAVEESHNIELGGGIVRMRIDFRQRDGSIGEHKTSARKWSDEQKSHDAQISAYCMTQGKSRTQTAHLLVAIKTKVPYFQHDIVARTPKQMEWFEQVFLAGAFAKHKSGVFEAHMDWQCGYCVVREQCGAW